MIASEVIKENTKKSSCVYARNFPLEFTKIEILELFRKFGKVEFLSFDVSRKPFTVTCNYAKNDKDREYGHYCANIAIKTLHGLTTINGIMLPKDKPFFC